MTYACQTWSLTDSKLEALCISQRKMEREFLGITLLDKKPYTWIRNKTNIRDIKDTVKDNLQRWAGHLAKFTDNRWTLSDSLVSTWKQKKKSQTKNKMG